MFEIFKSYQFNQEKAYAYGFVESSGVWIYSCQILQGDFVMTVSITADNVSFQVFDQEMGDLYPQVHMESMTGSFVASVREACLEILYQIRKACFDVQDFICPQTKRIMAQIQEKYGNQLEYLWEKSPDTAVLRHESNKKWYAVLMRISWDKLEKGREGLVEAVNLKHDQVADLLLKKGIYSAFHMNKRYWISVAFDDTLSDEIVLELIEKSWNLTSKK
ncbi:MmcQ family protein [Streptococcus mitis]|uniref:MmcQ family protein n=2 Tax=Streptococcus TaxID=1301 RepID=A0A2I1Z1L7_STRMT|nr:MULTISPECIES: MmcQ/YjbR family DNA-binding protein [Streptococcus]MDK6636406.1 MmcQ/YjbR family DNA-binding protein [Streptococcus mitis]MDK7133375.1 MmcQ/YjbR family DNA-binding protein [Streptococcus mitis]PKZ99030.1 MmcQ family protein [Streptococcus mitis]PLA61005.1 MmcQ family protein [Streptococcus mitis]PMB86573.1 MmcQ family protein [Streptococcus oralis subsp. dentisani]